MEVHAIKMAITNQAAEPMCSRITKQQLTTPIGITIPQKGIAIPIQVHLEHVQRIIQAVLTIMEVAKLFKPAQEVDSIISMVMAIKHTFQKDKKY